MNRAVSGGIARRSQALEDRSAVRRIARFHGQF
jgi:hypothetical protein